MRFEVDTASFVLKWSVHILRIARKGSALLYSHYEHSPSCARS